MIFILYVNGVVFLYEGMQGVGRKENGVAKNSVQRTSYAHPLNTQNLYHIFIQGNEPARVKSIKVKFQQPRGGKLGSKQNPN